MLNEKGLARNEAFGHLALENLERVAERMRATFGEAMSGQYYSEKYFTFVAVNEFFGTKADVRPSQRIRHIKVWREKEEDGREHGGITWSDTYGSGGMFVSAETEVEAREQDERDQVFVKFTHDRLIIQHFAPSGSRLHWTLALEDHTED